MREEANLQLLSPYKLNNITWLSVYLKIKFFKIYFLRSVIQNRNLGLEEALV